MSVSSAAAKHEKFLKLIDGWKWFAYLPAEARQWLAERMVLRQFDRGETVYVSGDRGTHVYGVISGVLRIYLTAPGGNDITLEEYMPGGWFPHMIPKEVPTYFGNCICRQEAVVGAVPQAVITELSRRWPTYFQGLYHELADRALVTLSRIELLSRYNLTVRLGVHLLRLAQLRGQAEADGSIWLGGFDNQSDIGANVGSTRQRVNEVLKSWAKAGLIEVNRRGLRFLDIEGLKIEVGKSGFNLDEYLQAYHGGWQERG